MLLLGLDRVINVAYSFLIILLLSRYVEPRLFGDFSVAMGLYQLSNIVLDAGMMGAIIKFPSNKAQRSTIFQLSIILVTGFYVILLTLNAFKIIDFENILFLVVVILSGYLNVHIYLCNARLIRLSKYRRYFSVSILSIILSSVSIAVLLVSNNAEFVLVSYILLMTLPAFLLHIFLRHNKYIPVFELDKIRPILRFAFPLFLANFISSIGRNFQFLFLNHYSGSRAGFFFHAEKASISPANLGVSLLDRMIFSTKSTESKTVLNRMLNKSNILIGFILISVNASLNYTDNIARIAYPNDYTKVVEIINVMAFVIVPLLITGLERVYIKCIGESRVILGADVILAALTILNVYINYDSLLNLAFFYVINAYVIAFYYLLASSFQGHNGWSWRLVFLIVSLGKFIYDSII